MTLIQFPSKATLVQDHKVDLAIVEFFGLDSVLDIDTVKLEFKRYEVILENGYRKIISKRMVDELIQKAEAKATNDEVNEATEANEVYEITSITEGFNGVYFVHYNDNNGIERKILQRYLSTIFQPGAKFYIGENRKIQLAG